MSPTHNSGGSLTFLRRLAEAGIDDTLILKRETAEQVITEKRMELIEELATDEVESVRDIARRVDRDVSIVSRDLDILFEAGVIDFEEDGRAKRPVLTHENILVQPLVFEGRVLKEQQDREEVEA